MPSRSEFRLGIPTEIPSFELCPLHLVAREVEDDGVAAWDGGVRFTARGWFEVLMTVAWDQDNDDGHRFAHTSIPDQHPLHSEAIEARVLNPLSNGRQLLRGNAIFDPGDVDRLRLEVWHNSATRVLVREAALVVRRLS